MDELDTARRYHCARCHQPVIICRDCDRGNIYCFDGCAHAAQAERCKRNAKRYRDSAKGRLNAAIRQCRYRLRQALSGSDAEPGIQHQHPPAPAAAEPGAISRDSPIVTHRGSADAPGNAPLLSTPTSARVMCCSRCQNACNKAVRVDFLSTPRHHTQHRQNDGLSP